MQTNGTKLKLHQPAYYRIGVQGVLDASWSDTFNGLTITCDRGAGPCPCRRDHGEPVTILTGELIDQAMLLGVLNGLYSLGLCLLWVEWLAEIGSTANLA